MTGTLTTFWEHHKEESSKTGLEWKTFRVAHVAFAITVSKVQAGFQTTRTHPDSLNPVALFQAAAAENVSPMHFT